MKLVIKGGDVAATTSGVVEDVSTIFSMDVNVGTTDRLIATGSLISEFLPISGRDVGDVTSFAMKFGDEAMGSGRKAADLGNKLEFLFGNATGSHNNIERSRAMFGQLERIGLRDSPQARAHLSELLQHAYRQPGVLQQNGRVLREFLIMGPKGGLKAESIWEDDRLITVVLYGAGQ